MVNVKQINPQSLPMRITATMLTAGVVNTRYACNMQTRAGMGTKTLTTVPIGQLWHLERISFNGTNPAPDAQIEIIVDDIPQTVTPKISRINDGLQHPFNLARTIMLPRGSTLAINIINIATVGGADVDVEFDMDFMTIPIAQN